MRPDEMRAYVRTLVDAAPPLNVNQRARLALLLRPAQSRPSPLARREAA